MCRKKDRNGGNDTASAVMQSLKQSGSEEGLLIQGREHEQKEERGSLVPEAGCGVPRPLLLGSSLWLTQSTCPSEGPAHQPTLCQSLSFSLGFSLSHHCSGRSL